MFAATVEDKEDPVDPTDDPDKNNTADAEGAVETDAATEDKEWDIENYVSALNSN